MSIRIGIGLDVFGAGIGADALAWRTNIIANGGTIPDATLAIFDANFFKPAKANGNILTELDRLNIYCGLVGYEIAARTNVIKSSHYVTPVSSPTFDNNGYKSSGTSYLNNNYIPSTEGVKYLLNSASIGLMIKQPVYTGTRRAIGVASLSRNDINFDGGSIYGFMNNAAGTLASSIQPTSGWIFVNQKRTAAAARSINVNGTIDNGVTSSTGLPNITQFELTANSLGVPAGNYDDKYHGASWNGSGNLDETSLRTILNNLFTALGV